MKCSDCGRYRTPQCYANPKSQDWDMAENYSCFIQRADGAPVPPVTPTPTAPSGMVVPERQSTSKSLLRIIGIALAVALVAAITYCVVITRDRDALNTELESVEAVLASTQAELSSTKQTLNSMQAELNSMQAELNSMQVELSSTKQTLVSIQNEFEVTKAKLKLYEETLGVKVFSNVQQPPITGGGLIGRPNLVNNPVATNPTWQELKAFLLADPTDDEVYSKYLFNCVSFAEMLHNNAEVAGIKAAFVAVHFKDEDPGHALNAFKTTDKGLVYVDCATNELFQRRTSEEWDKIAYLVKGKEYNSISLGKNTPLDYDSYEKMKADWEIYDQKLELYNDEVKEFNQEVSGKVYNIWNFEEWLQIKSWERSLEAQKRELDSLRAQLEVMWIPLGIVTNFEIYW